MRKDVTLSMESNVYHKPACRYVRRIQDKNKMKMMPKEARQYGYHACKCCNTMAYLYDIEYGSLEYYRKKHGMDHCMVDGIVYIKTSVSCWKLVYSRKCERIALYHRNKSDLPVNFEKRCDAQQRGIVLTSFSSERSRRLAQRSERKAQRNRLDYLFRTLERENVGYKELSFC